MKYKFGIELDPDEVRKLWTPARSSRLVHEKAETAYDEKEIEYPVMAGLSHFTARDAAGPEALRPRRARGLGPRAVRCRSRSGRPKNKQRDEIRDLLIEHSREYQRQANQALAEVQQQVEQLFDGDEVDRRPNRPLATAGGPTAGCTSLADWLKRDAELRLAGRGAGRARPRDAGAKSRPRPSKTATGPRCAAWSGRWSCNLLDTAWKDHLLAMDHLRTASACAATPRSIPRSSTSAKGMRTFEVMWTRWASESPT